MPQIANLVRRTVPSANTEGNNVQVRGDRYGGLWLPGPAQAAEEGQVFVATNPTMGTGLAGAAATTAFSATAALCILRSTASAGGKSILPVSIRMVNTAAGTGGVSAHVALVIDTINRYSSGGALLVPSSTRNDDAPASICSPYFGALVAAAATNQRILGRTVLKTQVAPCWTIGDEVHITFGCWGSNGNPGGGPIAGTTPVSIAKQMAPIAVTPGGSMVMHVWQPSQSAAASWEVEIVWWER